MNLRRIALRVANVQFPTYGLISAFLQNAGTDVNERRHQILKRELTSMGLHHAEHTGWWEGSREKSCAVKDVSPEVLELLGRKYGQDAVVYVAPGCRKLIRLKGPRQEAETDFPAAPPTSSEYR